MGSGIAPQIAKRYPSARAADNATIKGDADKLGTFTRAIVSLAHSLNLRVVAEGVEKQTQLAVLNALGCEEFQGYLFARPLPAAQLAGYLDEKSLK